MGCFAQKESLSLKQKFPFIDFIVGTKNQYIMQKILSVSSATDSISSIYTSLDNNLNFLDPVPDKSFPYRSFISIIKGCNNFCSYCIVPFTRGREVSVNSAKIIEQIKKLTNEGIIEIFLLGQNVNSYGNDNNDINFSKLLSEIAKIPEVKRINFLTSHPKDVNDELIDRIVFESKISKHMHLPLQSGSDKILGLMNRKYNFKDYAKIIEKLRFKNPKISITTDILVGFPEESEEDYLLTFNAIKNIEFDKAFVFMYSSREGTSAFNNEETLTLPEKHKRLQEIVNLQHSITKQKLQRFYHEISMVLIENRSKKNIRQMFGNNEFQIKVVVNGDKKDIGKIIPIKITGMEGHTLLGEKI